MQFIKNRNFITIAIFTTGRVFTFIIQLVNGFAITRLVQPSTLGFFNSITLIQNYLPWFHLGIFNGLNRELPLAFAKKDNHTIISFASLGYFWSIILGLTSFTILSCLALIFLFKNKVDIALVLFSNGIMGLSLFYASNYLSVTFRTTHDFSKLAVLDMIQGIISLLLILLIVYDNFSGLCIRSALLGITYIILLHIVRPIKVKPQWSKANFIILFKAGAPIFFVGYLYSWWNTALISTIIVFHGSKEMLGLYNIVLFVTAGISVFNQSISQIYYPKLLEAYATLGVGVHLLKKLIKPVLILFIINIFFLVMGFISIPKIILLVAPRYAASIVPSQLTLLLLIIQSFDIYLNIFNVLKKQIAYTFCIAIGITFTLLPIVLFKDSFSLILLVIATIIGRVFFSISYLIIIFKYTKSIENSNH
jgi:O-antigen/teichoic acid export membrane protein